MDDSTTGTNSFSQISPDFCYDVLTARRGCFADMGRGCVKTAFCDMIVMAVAV